jgi:hypothetical protein
MISQGSPAKSRSSRCSGLGDSNDASELPRAQAMSHEGDGALMDAWAQFNPLKLKELTRILDKKTI